MQMSNLPGPVWAGRASKSSCFAAARQPLRGVARQNPEGVLVTWGGGRGTPAVRSRRLGDSGGFGISNRRAGKAVMKNKGGDEVRWQLLLRSRDVPSWVVQAVVMHALQLRSDYRDVFMLCELQGHSIPDTAAILGIGPAVVASRLKRARRRMGEVVGHLSAHGDMGTHSTDQPEV